MPCRFKPGDYVHISQTQNAKIYHTNGVVQQKILKSYVDIQHIEGLCIAVHVYDKLNPEITTWLTVLSMSHGIFDVVGAYCRVV